MTPDQIELYEDLKNLLPDDLTPNEYEDEIKLILIEVERVQENEAFAEQSEMVNR